MSASDFPLRRVKISNPLSAAFRLLILALLPCLIASPALIAQESEETAEEPLWTGTTGLAFLATSGNSETESLGLNLELARRPTPWGVTFKALFDRAEDSGEVTAERYYAGVRAVRTLGERYELFAGLSGEQDELAGLDFRTLVEVGGTYLARQGPVHHLSFDLGLTWTDEDRLPPALDESYLGAVAGLKYEWKISETASFSQRLAYFPNFDESDDWRAESDTSVTASMTDRLALKVGFEVRYRNQPIGLRDDTDTSTKVSLVWTL